MEGPLPLAVCIDEVDGGFALRCDRLGEHAWHGSTPEEALETFAADVRSLMDLYMAHLGPGVSPARAADARP